TLDVPSGAPGTPRGGPGCRLRLGGLGALPEREVARVALAARGGIRRLGHVVELLPRELAVARPGAHVEVHIARAVVGDVGVAALDESRDELLHLRDARRGPGLVGGRQDADRA